jgi:hypothetical protein
MPSCLQENSELHGNCPVMSSMIAVVPEKVLVELV